MCAGNRWYAGSIILSVCDWNAVPESVFFLLNLMIVLLSLLF